MPRRLLQGRNDPSGNPTNQEHATTDAGESGANFARDFLNTLQDFLQQQTPTNNVRDEPRPEMRTNEVVEQFHRFAPPRFKGKEGPIAAEEWLLKLERIFDHMECTEEQKVRCAIFQLADDAGHWWASHARTMTEEQKQTLTWNEFKEIIMDRYFPQYIRDQKKTEFLNLKQGTLPKNGV
ncbi:hypothetical protein DH2020_000542 [Rehmannia glutinosa]|uniref:Retrotransposon gag domain-containing protein n=1 Tax=Rehmannia glutinosa TaxID=99300 RepID=A0ABR0XX85_REHGL